MKGSLYKIDQAAITLRYCGAWPAFATSGGDSPGFSEMILVFTGPQSAHMKLWSARSWQLGCRSKTDCIIALRHLGQTFSAYTIKDIASFLLA
jgi:hypothetical protein